MQRQTTAPARVWLVAPIRAAIYARVSSDQQAERHTVDSQVRSFWRAGQPTGTGSGPT